MAFRQQRFFLEAENIGAKHGFSLRTGSEIDFLKEAGFSRLPVIIKQVHGNAVVKVDHEPERLEGDALITDRPGMPIAVKTADCVPILLFDPIKGAIAAVHAGWRGTAKRIVQAAIDRMKEEYGSLPGDICAAVGPAIGACCYEVGPEAIQELRELPGAEQCISVRGGKTYADLKGFNDHQLKASGVMNIDVTDFCTRCEDDLFFSYRRNGANAGRMIAVIELPVKQG